ncbi:MAG: hypothetical protein ACFFD2_10240 [Promethearchaeota archaeon]
MSAQVFSIEFIILSSIQTVTVMFSFITFISGLKRYFNTNQSEIFLRKGLKYFSFILLTIAIAGIFAIIVNFFFIFTSNGIISGYLYCIITTSVFINTFCAWQFLNYLIHPKRRNTKYIIGICCTIGIIIIWFYPGIMTNVFHSPFVEKRFIYLYLVCLYFFVYGFFAFEFFKHSYFSSDKKEKYRFFCLGMSALFSILMFLGFFLGLFYTWIIILNSTVLLYLGYNFPKFFQRALKIQD